MIAERFLAQGAKVNISARKVDLCEAASRHLGPNSIAVPAYVSTVDGPRALAVEIWRRKASLDAIVNNAAAARGAEFREFPESSWNKVSDVNVKASFFQTQAKYPAVDGGVVNADPPSVIDPR